MDPVMQELVEASKADGSYDAEVERVVAEANAVLDRIDQEERQAKSERDRRLIVEMATRLRDGINERLAKQKEARGAD